MNRASDTRIQVVFGGAPGTDDVVLVEAADWQTSHPAGCPCCGARSAAGRALGHLLVARGRGDIPFFRRVVVRTTTQAGRAAFRTALRDDPIASVAYRLNE